MTESSKIEKVVEISQFERGKIDAQQGHPPREGTIAYLEGYALQYSELGPDPGSIFGPDPTF